MNDGLWLDMLKLSKEGFRCAQILMILALKQESEENQSLIRAAGGLNVGLADMSGPCGALTGACCLISYFAGKGEADELEDPALPAMLSEFSTWFSGEHAKPDGDYSCSALLDGELQNMRERCPGIVQGAYLKAMEILDENGVFV